MTNTAYNGVISILKKNTDIAPIFAQKIYAAICVEVPKHQVIQWIII